MSIYDILLYNKEIMTDNSFEAILNKIVSERGIVIFDNPAKCNGLLQDYANGGYKREIRLLLQALEAGAYKEIFNSDDPDLGAQKTIKKLQSEYAIAKDAAEATVTMLTALFKNLHTNEENVGELEKRAQNGDNNAQYKLGLLLEKQGKYKESNYWFKTIVEKTMDANTTFSEKAVKKGDRQKTAKKIVEKDVEYGNTVWVCGRCGNSNEIFLSNCLKCGKQFSDSNED